MKRNIVADIISILFILLFVYAAVSKLIDYQTFKIQIAQSPILTTYAGFIVWAIPLIEIAIAVLLSLQGARLIGLYAAFSIMLLFSGYIFTIINYSDFIPCSCGGILQKMTWTQHLSFNIAFVVLGIVGIFQFRHGVGNTINVFSKDNNL